MPFPSVFWVSAFRVHLPVDIHTILPTWTKGEVFQGGLAFALASHGGYHQPQTTNFSASGFGSYTGSVSSDHKATQTVCSSNSPGSVLPSPLTVFQHACFLAVLFHEGCSILIYTCSGDIVVPCPRFMEGLPLKLHIWDIFIS